MVTITEKKAFRYKTGESGEMEAINLIEAYGLSTDDKPTDNVANGSMFIEMDTGGVHFFDAENEEWLMFNGGGG